MRKAILASIKSRPMTTFQQLAEDVAGFRGNLGMFTPDRDSIIIWHACSREAIDALAKMIGDHSIKMQIAPNVSYKLTNDLPPCPVCRDLDDFKSDTRDIRWFPVVFTEGSPGERSGELSLDKYGGRRFP
jgi:hypothetical protein